MSDTHGTAGVFRSFPPGEAADSAPEIRILRPSRAWSPENFASEQIRGLVRQVFFSNALRAVRQIVISPVEAETDVQSLCRRVGHALALETTGSVAVVGRHNALSHDEAFHDEPSACHAELKAEPAEPLRRNAVPVSGNFWLVQATAEIGRISDSKWHAHLCELRTGFEYSIVEGPPAAESSEAVAMAQLADGIILVLSARHTRRATALHIKQRLEAGQARILGTVLADRNFPIPESIYRRL